MWWIIAWVSASIAAALVLGLVIRRADEQELTQSENELEPA